MPFHVYVSNAGSDFLSHFLMDEENGLLQAQADIPMGGPPGALATNRDGSRLFACLRSQGEYVSFDLDSRTGALSRIDATSVSEGAPYLATDNTDRFLLATYYGAGGVSVHAIGADGRLSPEPLQWIETDGHAHSIQTDRSNRFAYVPHTMPANAIFQFRFDEATGALTPNDPPKVQPETGEGPRHFVFHPSLDVLYSINEDGCTVSAHHFDAESGRLSSFQVLSTLPHGAPAEGESTAEIAITPDGRHLYGSNRGHDSLALFEVAADGRLTARGHTPTEATPRFFDLDPTGRYLYSAGQTSGKVAVFRIDAGGGALERIQTCDVGESPLWIQFVEQDRS